MADPETVLRIASSLARWSTSPMPVIRPTSTRHENDCRIISCVVLGTLKSLSQTDKLSSALAAMVDERGNEVIAWINLTVKTTQPLQ
ncbi:hypothetical protein ABVT39_022937 [Epinephelus coioides]